MAQNRNSRLAAAECAMVSGARLPDCYDGRARPHASLLYSAGILTHDFCVVIIGTPQGTSKDHEGPGDSTSPGPFHLLAMRTRSRALRYCTDPLVDCPLRLRCCWNPRVRRALSLHGRRSENDDAHPPVDRPAVCNLVGVLEPGAGIGREQKNGGRRRLNARARGYPSVLLRARQH